MVQLSTDEMEKAIYELVKTVLSDTNPSIKLEWTRFPREAKTTITKVTPKSGGLFSHDKRDLVLSTLLTDEGISVTIESGYKPALWRVVTQKVKELNHRPE